MAADGPSAAAPFALPGHPRSAATDAVALLSARPTTPAVPSAGPDELPSAAAAAAPLPADATASPTARQRTCTGYGQPSAISRRFGAPGKLQGRPVERAGELNFLDEPSVSKPRLNPICLPIRFAGKLVNCLADTGASDCFISEQCLRSLPDGALVAKTGPAVNTITTADGSAHRVLSTVRLRFDVHGTIVFYDFHVLPTMSHDVIVGRNLLADLRASAEPHNGKISLFQDVPLVARAASVIPPMSQAVVRVRPKRACSTGGDVMCTPAHLTQVVVAHGLNTGPPRNWVLQVSNMLDTALTVTPSQVLAYVEPADAPGVKIDAAQSFCELNSVTVNSAPTRGPGRRSGLRATQKQESSDQKEQIDAIDLSASAMNEQQTMEFRRLLHKHHQVVAFSMDDLGHCTISPMVIEVDESKGISSARPYRYAPQKQDIIREQVRQLLEVGVIEPSESAWRSPIVLVQKKDGGARLCVDFRYINLLTKRRPWPMATTRSLFLYLASKKPKWISTIDLLSGYFQMELAPSSRKYTAFETPDGVFHFRRVAFGLVGAPWHFSKVMSVVLKGLVPDVCLAYLDDIIIYDATFEEHLVSLGKVFTALIDAGLRLKPSKCEFCKNRLEFLGHVVSSEGLEAQPRILRKIREFPTPVNEKSLRSFLGLANYYRAFIRGLGAMSVPLYELLTKGAKFDWTAERNGAFLQIQRSLINPPLLIHPELRGHFYVLTDSSDKACGAAICHKIDSIFRPILYYSYVMNKAEQNYSVTEKEALAVVRSMLANDDMFFGGTVTIVTDHQALVQMLQEAHKNKSRRMQRWALALADFDYTVVHQPGAVNHLPDFLSRAKDPAAHLDGNEFEPDVGCELLGLQVEGPGPDLEDEDGAGAPMDEFAVHIPAFTDEELLGAQQEDAFCKEMSAYLKRDELPDDHGRAMAIIAQCDSLMLLDNGLLARAAQPHKRRKRTVLDMTPRVVLPESMVPKVLELLHDDMMAGGHVGVIGLQTKVTQRYWWRRMHNDILEYVRKCEKCGLRKRAPHYKALAKSWDIPAYPFQRVQCDYVGPLFPAKDGSRYILCFIDLLTGWPEGFPTPDASARTAAKVFVEQILCRTGRVEMLHTDRGSHFRSQFLRDITARLNCRQSFTSGRLAVGNARVERMQRTLQEVMALYLDDQQDDWPSVIPIALWTIRSTISARSGFSPFALLFGRDPPMMGLADRTPLLPVDNETKWYERIVGRLKLFREMAESTVRTYNEGIRAKIDRTARPSDLVVGDLVFYYDPPAPSANYSAKLCDRYKGPYRVLETKGDHLLRLQNVATGDILPHFINVQKVKRAYVAAAPALDYAAPKAQTNKRRPQREALPIVTDDDPNSGILQPKPALPDGTMDRAAGPYKLRTLKRPNYVEQTEPADSETL